jgi:FAD/FMN-containing dehydrogenase
MTGVEWVEAFAAQLGVAPPDAETIEALLSLASTAAHGSERLAAPLACYLVGVAGGDLAAAQKAAAAVVARVAQQAEGS